MNILYVKLRRGFYGGEKQTEELIRGLQKKYHQLFLITVTNSEIGKHLKDIPQFYFDLYPYPDKRTKSLLFLILLPYFYLNFYFKARKFVKKYNIDLVCLQEPHERIVCGPIFKLLGVKVTWLEILYWEPYLKRNFLIFRPMLWSLKFCNGIILSSDFLQNQTKPYIGNITTIVTKHALQTTEQKKLKAISHECYPIKNIGFIGSIYKVKGVFVLLDAFKKIHQQYPDLKLFYAGNGDELDNLKLKIKNLKLENCIKVLGKQNAYTFYKDIDLLVVPSYLDNLPYVLQEAICAKIPIIGSNTGGIPEYFYGKSEKWLFEPGNSAELAQKISTIIKLNKKQLQDIANYNFEFYQKNFIFEKMLDETEKFFQSI